MLSVIAFTRQGVALSKRIQDLMSGEIQMIRYTTKQELSEADPEIHLVSQGLSDWCQEAFIQSEAILFIGACGIAVRTIAPFLQHKSSDPAVLVADEMGKHVISLLSGHLGGANHLAEQIAQRIGGEAVITTASDVNKKLAIDVWAKENGLSIHDMKLAKQVAAQIVDGKRVPFACQGEIKGQIPWELELTQDTPMVAVSIYDSWPEQVLRLIPRSVILGIGCRRGKPLEEIRTNVEEVLRAYQIAPESICCLASIDLKAEEEGLIAYARELGVPFNTFPAEVLQQVPGEYETSEFVRGITGVDNVCERAAVAALEIQQQEHAEFLCRKQKKDGVTVALIQQKWSVSF